ncbi:MAG: GNAT family N-acetyltransferase [Vicinamibacterales bacterium]|nr:GNAT family N-acetyltransferase [Vicinamibacterales bacterium]
MSSPPTADPWILRDGTAARIRPIRPDDEPLLVEFHRYLSDRTVFLRYFHLTKLDQRVKHERLARLCTVDPATEAALVVERDDAAGAPAIIAVGRLTRPNAAGDAEVALLVSDAYQGQGLGKELMRRLEVHARRIGVRRIVGEILSENDSMLAVARRTGFTVRAVKGDPQVLRAELPLDPA